MYNIFALCGLGKALEIRAGITFNKGRVCHILHTSANQIIKLWRQNPLNIRNLRESWNHENPANKNGPQQGQITNILIAIVKLFTTQTVIISFLAFHVWCFWFRNVVRNVLLGDCLEMVANEWKYCEILWNNIKCIWAQNLRKSSSCLHYISLFVATCCAGDLRWLRVSADKI